MQLDTRKLLLTVAIALSSLTALSEKSSALTVYSNTTTSTGQSFSPGGATTISGNGITRLIADRITLDPSTTDFAITGFTFSVTNLGTNSVSARPRVRFYQTDGTGGAPGTLIAAFSFNAITFAPNSEILLNAATSFTAPSTFWAGIVFDNNSGATGATLTDLNGLGQGIYNPPTIGSSTDQFFTTSSAGAFNSNNPPGSLTSFGGNPVANFGWQFRVADPPTPVPFQFSPALGFVGLGVLRLGLKSLKVIKRQLC